jgi:hypothetical protein
MPGPAPLSVPLRGSPCLFQLLQLLLLLLLLQPAGGRGGGGGGTTCWPGGTAVGMAEPYQTRVLLPVVISQQTHTHTQLTCPALPPPLRS